MLRLLDLMEQARVFLLCRLGWLVLSVKTSWVWNAGDLSTGFHMVHGFCFHEASARFEGGFLVEMMVPMVSSMAVCNDDGKRFSDWAKSPKVDAKLISVDYWTLIS
jgi:hypothetical protein